MGPGFDRILGIDDDEVMNVYLQAQMLLSLRAAQEAEKGEDHGIWPDFGRFNESRVVPLLDRMYNDSDFASGLSSAFGEAPDVWREKVNQRLQYIRSRYWRNANFWWDSIRAAYEPRG